MKGLKIFLVLLVISFLMVACNQEDDQVCMHEFDYSVTVQPSCAQMGVETAQCKLCTYCYTTPIPSLEHSFDDGVITKPATCEEEGVRTYSCTVCNAEKTEQLPVSYHMFGAAELTKVPNCTEHGEKTSECQICGVQIVVAHLGTDPNNHVFVTTVIQEATCEQGGESRNDCTLCDESETLFFEPLAHQYGDYHVITEATCSNTGLREQKCNACGYVNQEVLAKLEHTWDATECGRATTCTVCGYYNAAGLPHQYHVISSSEPSVGFIGRRLHHCDRCGKEYFSYFGKHGDYDLEWVRQEAFAFARSLGFTIDTSFSYTVVNPSRIPFYELEARGGVSVLVEKAKERIMQRYNKYSSEESWANGYDLNVQIVFFENSTYGSNFYIHVYTRPRPSQENQNGIYKEKVPVCIR